jgi:hypothetical protein
MKPATQPVTHTPGPWKVGPEYIAGIPIYFSDDTHFCTISRPLTLTDYANANLIAAAPELLEALKEAKELIRFFHGDPAWEIYDSSSPEMKRLNAAIAKATGAEGTRP